MNHIERMKNELSEVELKIKKLDEFLKSEILSPGFTDEIQRIRLSVQLEYMLNYASVLKERIEYDTKKMSV